MQQTRKEAKAQASKLKEIRKALISAGYDTTAMQAAALGVGRSTAYALLNLDKRAGPSAIIIKRILSSSALPPRARQKIKEYVEEKVYGRYGHSERRMRVFRDVLRSNAQRPDALKKTKVTFPLTFRVAPFRHYGARTVKGRVLPFCYYSRCGGDLHIGSQSHALPCIVLGASSGATSTSDSW